MAKTSLILLPELIMPAFLSSPTEAFAVKVFSISILLTGSWRLSNRPIFDRGNSSSAVKLIR